MKMVKVVINGKLTEIGEDELEMRFSPKTISIDQMAILKSLAEKPKQIPAVMKDLGLKESGKDNYSKVRYHIVRLSKEGLIGKYKINAKTVLWFLTEKGLEKLEG